MTWYCTGNGQMHNVSMQEVANTLDTMHDAQIVERVRTYTNSTGGVQPQRLLRAITKAQAHGTERSGSTWQERTRTPGTAGSMCFAA